jgi:hypothetical protein
MESVRKILNDSQTSTDAYSYEAFGNIMSQAGSTVNPFRYVGALGYYRDLAANHQGERCARRVTSVSRCGSCCKKIYPPPCGG